MSRVTKFAGRDPGFGARMSGFMAHLRDNGLRLGVEETATALQALALVTAADPAQARLALKAVCSGSADEAERFDDLFNAYWMNAGRVRDKVVTAPQTKPATGRSGIEDSSRQSSGTGRSHSPDGEGEGDSASDGTGKLVASSVNNLMKKDLRDLVSPQDIAEAEAVAERLGKAIRDRRSRRRRAARRGDQIDFRRLVRKSLSTGGEPLHLPMRQRPTRDVKFVALCDVSGSMTAYARPFLAFLAGLIRADARADSYIFPTRLVRITEALRDPDPLRALNRLTLLSDGFGGGSKIGANLAAFARTYARRFVDGRSVVFILSDGYDTDAEEQIGEALAEIRKRGCRIVWLNPLKGWDGYEPVARGMAAALPHLDGFYAANTLQSLAALEEELARL
ncbi:MAG: VWA domain-containing protein [Rhodobacteraceae bacterium]|nr:VWA domain-containing protein [Paracoccaceae bacterium]